MGLSEAGVLTEAEVRLLAHKLGPVARRRYSLRVDSVGSGELSQPTLSAKHAYAPCMLNTTCLVKLPKQVDLRIVFAQTMSLPGCFCSCWNGCSTLEYPFRPTRH